MVGDSFLPPSATMMQFTPQSLGPILQAIANASTRMSEGDASAWRRRLELGYGDLAGQRRVDFTDVAPDLEPPHAIAALESTYYLISVLISISAFDPDPAGYLRHASQRRGRSFDSWLEKILDGTVYDDVGIHGCHNSVPLGWLGEREPILRQELRQLIRMVATCWDGATLKIAGDDPMQQVHRQLFPVNLMHITGQFYSPQWLAELCLADVAWQPEETLLDPFCGSGIFLVKALRISIDAGEDSALALRKIGGIDINPFATAATRANLALTLARHDPDRQNVVSLNIECGDAIGPSIAKASQREGGHDSDSAIGFAADVVATNPPWVGWEYLSRPYRNVIQPAWRAHDLYLSRGLEASFLKEDLSNLALLAAWDAYLRDGGRSVVVLRPSTMHSEIASRGLRRLSLREGGTEIKLHHIRTFDRMRLFKSASTPAATWIVQKGERTEFPVRVSQFEKTTPRWNPDPADSMAEVETHVRTVEKLAEPTAPDDVASRWMIVPSDSISQMRKLRGANTYVPRMGVFTGGANGVFYLEPAPRDSPHAYRNVTRGTKRKVPAAEFDVEPALVFPLARGRDLKMWQCNPELRLLMPHTSSTRMQPIAANELATDFPRTFRYLCSMKQVLEQRNGFAGWEKKMHREFFYALQRIGSYTFAPYKVAWRYIASEFTVCVIENEPDGKTVVPNDKVMFIPMEDPEEAYFVAGFLSSRLVRDYVGCVVEKRQVSTRVIQSLAIPTYEPEHALHQTIRDCCLAGHQALRENPESDVHSLRQEVDRRVKELCLSPVASEGTSIPEVI